MNMTLSQGKAENTSPMTGVQPRTDKNYLERDVQMRTKMKQQKEESCTQAALYLPAEPRFGGKNISKITVK